MSTSARLSIPLHFSSASSSSLDGPALPKDWRYKWHRRDYPRRRKSFTTSNSDDDSDCDESLEDEDVDRWATCMTVWSDREQGDDESKRVDHPSSLRISVADENGIGIAISGNEERKAIHSINVKGKNKDVGVAIGLHNGSIWIFREGRKKREPVLGRHQADAKVKTQSCISNHLSSSQHLKSSAYSSFHHNHHHTRNHHNNNSHHSPDMDLASPSISAVAETSDVNAMGSATRFTTNVDAEERLETQWHAGRENTSVMGGVMGALGLHHSEKHHTHPHTHPHTQSSSEQPSGTSTPASPAHKRRAKKEMNSPLSPSPSMTSISTSGRPRNASSATLMDQWEKDSTNSDADSHYKHRLTNLMGSPMQRKTSRASYEATEVPSLIEAVKSLEIVEVEGMQFLNDLEPYLILQTTSSSSPIVSVERIRSDQLISLQEDGNLILWSLAEAKEIQSMNVKTAKIKNSEPIAPPSVSSSPLVASTTFSALVGIRSNTNSPAPGVIPSRSRTNSNATKSSKTVLDTVATSGLGRLYSMQIIPGHFSSTLPLLLCYDDVNKLASIVDLEESKVISTYAPLLCHNIPPVGRMSGDGDRIDIFYINTKNSIQLHTIKVATAKSEDIHIEPIKHHTHLSSASAFLRREGYSNVPSRAPSIAEEKPENLDLGNGGLKEDILGFKMLKEDLFLIWTALGAHLMRKVADSMLLVHTENLTNIQEITFRGDCVGIERAGKLFLYRLSKDITLEQIVVDQEERNDNFQTYSLYNDCAIVFSVDSEERCRLTYNANTIWQEPKRATSMNRITATLPYSMERIVISLSSGHLFMSSLMELASGWLPEASSSNSVPHKGNLLFLRLISNPRTQIKFIVGGTEEGDIILWDAITLKLQSQRSLLTCPVVDIIVLGKDDNTLRLNGCMACLGADGSLVMFLLDGMTDLYTIPGRGVPLEELAVRTDELILIYEDARARVWDMKMLELRRSIGIEQALSLLDDNKGWWSRHSVGVSHMKVDSGSAGVLSSIPSSRDCIAGTMNANLRRAIEAASRMVALLLPQHDEIEETLQTISGTYERLMIKDNFSVSITSPNGKRAIQILRPLLHSLIPIGLDDEIDSLARTLLGVSELQMTKWIHSGTSSSKNDIVMCVQGEDAADLLCVSGITTGTRLLGLISMLLITSNILELHSSSINLLTILGTLSNFIGEEYKSPCLTLLIDYINDSVVEIRQAAQTLFTTSLELMSQEDIEALSENWSSRLPTRDGNNDEKGEASKAVMLLGLIATQRYTILQPNLLKEIANSIALYLHNDSDPLRQMEAIFLCDRGFSIFQHYFDAMDVMRTLFSLSVSKYQDSKEDVTPDAIEARNLARRATLRVSEENTPLFMTTLSMDILHAQSPAHCNATMRLVALIVRKKPLILYPNLPRLAEAVVKSLDPTVTSMRTVVHRSATIIISELVATYPTIAFHKELQRLAVGTFEGAIIMYDLKTSTRLYVIEAHYSSLGGLSFSQDGRRLVSVCLHDSKVKVWKTGVGFSSFLNFGGAPRQGGLLSVASSTPMTLSISSNSINSSSTGEKALPPLPNNLLDSGGGTNAYKTFEFSRVTENPVTSPITDGLRLDLINFHWVSNRSIKIHIGMTSMQFDVT